MRKFLLLLLFIPLVSVGQTKEGVELCFEYQKSISSFTSEKEANEALDKILSVIGASKNFTLIPCDNTNNALAITFKGERYILFDSDFMKKINEITNDWSSIFILAHEVGHHINGHTRDFLLASILEDNSLAKKRKEELEADEFAGFVVSKLGATFLEVQELVNLSSKDDNDNFSTHPNKSKRLLAVKTGFDRAISQTKNYTTNDSSINSFKVSGEWTIYEEDLEKNIINYYSDPSYTDPNNWKGVSADVFAKRTDKFEILKQRDFQLERVKTFGSKFKKSTLTGQVYNSKTKNLISSDSIFPKLSFSFFEMPSKGLFFNRNQFIVLENILPIIKESLNPLFEDEIIKDSTHILLDKQSQEYQWKYKFYRPLKKEFKSLNDFISYDTHFLSEEEWLDDKYYSPRSEKILLRENFSSNDRIIFSGDYMIDDEILGCFKLVNSRAAGSALYFLIEFFSENPNANSINYEDFKNFVFIPYCNLSDPRIEEENFINKLKNSNKLELKINEVNYVSKPMTLSGPHSDNLSENDWLMTNTLPHKLDGKIFKINEWYMKKLGDVFEHSFIDKYSLKDFFNIDGYGDSNMWFMGERIYPFSSEQIKFEDDIYMLETSKLIQYLLDNNLLNGSKNPWEEKTRIEEAKELLNTFEILKTIKFNEIIIFDLSGSSEALKRP